MRTHTPQHALLALILRAAPALINIACPTCGVYYDPSSPAESYPHNNH